MVTDHEAEAWVAEGLRYGAQMFWNAKTPKADGNVAAFKARIKALGEPSTFAPVVSVASIEKRAERSRCLQDV